MKYGLSSPTLYAPPERDDKLIALLLEAQATRDNFLDNPTLTISAMPALPASAASD